MDKDYVDLKVKLTTVKFDRPARGSDAPKTVSLDLLCFKVEPGEEQLCRGGGEMINEICEPESLK